MAMISIIVPIYNVEEYLERCIRSILCQTYSDFELILVDDGSDDGSLSICRRYEILDNRIIILSLQNDGVSNARNAGLSIATGEYLMFVDSDDWIIPETVQHMINIINQYEPDMIRFGYKKIREQRVMGRYVLPYATGLYKGNTLNRIRMDSINTEYILDYSKTRIMSVWSCVFKRKLLVEHHIFFEPYDRILNEDYLFVLQAIWAAVTLYVSDDLVYCYDTRNNSLSTVYRPHMYERKLNLFERYSQVVSKKDREVEIRLRNFYIDCIYDCIVNECRNRRPRIQAIREINILLSDPFLQQTLILNRSRITSKKVKCICFLMRHRMPIIIYLGYHGSKWLQERWLNIWKSEQLSYLEI